MDVPEELMRKAHELRSTLPAGQRPPDTDALLRWFTEEHHGQTHRSLEVYQSAEAGLSFRVAQTGNATITAGEPVVVCPLSASLSYLNAIGGGQPLGKLQEPGTDPSLAFPRAFTQKVPPHVIGRFFLMQQFRQGTASPWAPYISTLPQPQDYDSWALPAVWPDEGGDAAALALLEGTNAEVAAAEMRQRIESEFRAAWPLLGDDKHKNTYTFALYEWAYCIFTSRSFRPSLVLTPEIQAALARGTDDAVDARHLAMINHASMPQGCGIDDFSLLLPVLDIGNHDPRAVVQWTPVVDASRTALSSAAVLTPAPSTSAEHAIVFLTGGATHNSGQPVFNNYGSKTNSELLVGYGFVLAPTRDMHNDYVHLRKRGELDAYNAAAAGTSANAVHRDFLLSLRPMDAPSSPVGLARLPQTQHVDGVTTPDSTRQRSPGFALADDGLLWDMLSLMLQPENRDQVQRYAVVKITGKPEYLTASMAEVHAAVPTPEQLRDTILDLVFRTHPSGLETPALLRSISMQVRLALLYKFDADLEKLQAKDAALASFAPSSPHERLALQYRTQYATVLSNAIDVLGREAEDDDDDEEESDDEEEEDK
ncbi:hypothetical protein SCUCBS95973_000749 [Sporothrix curviconia]|uniref:SET domain-containing protein n=1 Tax=Sporothrix curviconia TaxID=1260050 RepID=A0ABP0AT67_9PEZI